MKTIKTIIASIAIFTLMVGPVNAQIFTTDDANNARIEGEDVLGRIPNQWVTYDQYNQYAPIGEGVFLLTALGGVYLLHKKRKNK